MTNSYSTPSPKGFLFGQFFTNLARTANGKAKILLKFFYMIGIRKLEVMDTITW